MLQRGRLQFTGNVFYDLTQYLTINNLPITMQKITSITLIVDDYDKAIEFYTQKLSFELLEDTVLSDTKRWVLVAPKGSECKILLAKAANPEQASRVGNQTGGRVFLFLHTDNFEQDFQDLLVHGVTIIRPPAKEPYGMVAVFADLYGNHWDMIGLAIAKEG
jgi:catechol 2,3-dioxygenase-like lactoylglutathione lyase family enzyme